MIKWGLIGLGGIGLDIAKVLMKEKQLKSIYTRNIGNNKNLQYINDDIDIFEDRDLFFNSDINAIYIASPNNAHYLDIKEALLAGKHVLCEKAILSSSIQLKELEDLAKLNDLILAEAMTIYHMPVLAKAKQLIDEDIIGNIENITCFFGSVKPYDINNRFFNKDLGGGVMLDIGTYALSMMQFFSEDLFTLKYKDVLFENDVDTNVIATLTNGSIDCILNLSFKIKYPKLCVIAGPKGYIEINDYPRAQKIKVVLLNGQCLEYEIKSDALENEINNFNNAILNNKDDNLCTEKTKNVVALIDKILS